MCVQACGEHGCGMCLSDWVCCDGCEILWFHCVCVLRCPGRYIISLRPRRNIISAIPVHKYRAVTYYIYYRLLWCDFEEVLIHFSLMKLIQITLCLQKYEKESKIGREINKFIKIYLHSSYIIKILPLILKYELNIITPTHSPKMYYNIHTNLPTKRPKIREIQAKMKETHFGMMLTAASVNNENVQLLHSSKLQIIFLFLVFSCSYFLFVQ